MTHICRTGIAVPDLTRRRSGRSAGMLARGDPSRDTQGSRLAGSYAGSVSSLAPKTPSCSSPGRELIADVQRISTDEADSTSCFSLDGEGLELARDM